MRASQAVVRLVCKSFGMLSIRQDSDMHGLESQEHCDGAGWKPDFLQCPIPQTSLGLKGHRLSDKAHKGPLQLGSSRKPPHHIVLGSFGL